MLTPEAYAMLVNKTYGMSDARPRKTSAEAEGAIEKLEEDTIHTVSVVSHDTLPFIHRSFPLPEQMHKT